MNNNYLILNNKIKLPTKVALTPKEHQLGLMFQSDPPIMTFLYPDLKIRKFWMKNTPCNLLILFYKNNKLLDSCTGRAYDERPIGPDLPCNKVIEIPLPLAQEIINDDHILINLKLNFNTFKKYCQLKYN